MNSKRKAALREYIILRVKLIEFFDMGALRKGLKADEFKVPEWRLAKDFVESLRTVQISWFALLVDKNGMNAIKVWRELFPNFRKEIDETWCRIEPTWEIIRKFRNRAGFHADTAFKFFRARRGINENQAAVNEATIAFQQLISLTTNAEPEALPDLEEAVDSLLDDLEKDATGRRYNRAEFKRYLMIPTKQQPKGTLPEN